MQWFSEYGYLIIVFIVLLAAFVFLLIKAASAYSNHNKAYKAQEAEIRRLTALKEKFRNASAKELDSFPQEEILEGTALLYQIALQKCDDMEAEFEKLSTEKKYIYVLDVFTQDESVGEFFSQNSELLTGIIIDALDVIGMTDFSSELSIVAKMFDKDNEEISFSRVQLENFDKMMSDKNILSEIKLNAAKYIKENYDILKC